MRSEDELKEKLTWWKLGGEDPQVTIVEYNEYFGDIIELKKGCEQLGPNTWQISFALGGSEYSAYAAASLKSLLDSKTGGPIQETETMISVFKNPDNDVAGFFYTTEDFSDIVVCSGLEDVSWQGVYDHLRKLIFKNLECEV